MKTLRRIHWFVCLVIASSSGAAALAADSISSNVRGKWISTGDLASPSYAGEAVRLSNGDVLFAGRAGNSDFTNAEIYEVANSMWRVTSPMRERRAMPTLTLLKNSKALVVGGFNSRSGILSSAELFDPATQTWTNTGTMQLAHCKHTATLLRDGKVLVAGGYAGTNEVIVYEMHEENSGTQTVRRITCSASIPSATEVNRQHLFNDFTAAELFDPATGEWRRTGAMKQPRGNHTATILTNGLVLVAGGINDTSGALASAEIYDPASGVWSEVGEMHQARAHHTATLLPDGKVLVAGGQDAEGKTLGEAELFDPSARTWTTTGEMFFDRSYHTAALLENGQVLVVGGNSNHEGATASAELYHPSSGNWTRAMPMPVVRHWHTATMLQNGRMLIAGGVSAGMRSPYASSYLFDASPTPQ